MAKIVHVITGEPDKGKGKNKRVAENVLSISQDPWTKQQVSFDPSNKAISFFQNDPLVVNILLN